MVYVVNTAIWSEAWTLSSVMMKQREAFETWIYRKKMETGSPMMGRSPPYEDYQEHPG